ncbi:MAG: hypothetical protein K1000chlam2_00665 [Chlamydiae bacterium]|nr:hypothetical protein [Chlamydiota bacterium]
MLLFISIWAIAVNWLAYRKGFYQFPKLSKKAIPHVTTIQLLASFGLYLILALFIAPLFVKFLFVYLKRMDIEFSHFNIVLITGIQCTVMITIFVLLQLFMRQQDPLAYKKIWKDKDRTPTYPTEFDLGLGVVSWFLIFPVVTIISDILDKILRIFFQLNDYEQAAVKFVKAAKNAPLSLVFALLSILVLAPFIEEFLFRGVLQTYCKKRLGPHAAIIISALLFSLFHISTGQGLGNISLVVSLFLLGGFLGFLYERQGSLWAPIGLHMAFNAVSALRIVILPEVL